jgi:hypothetical protein
MKSASLTINESPEEEESVAALTLTATSSSGKNDTTMQPKESSDTFQGLMHHFLKIVYKYIQYVGTAAVGDGISASNGAEASSSSVTAQGPSFTIQESQHASSGMLHINSMYINLCFIVYMIENSSN